MLFISRARIIAKTCNFVLQKPNVNKFTINSLLDHVKIQVLSPAVLHQRLYSNTSHDSNLETIYEGKLTKYVKAVKIFSLSTSALTLLSQPYLLPKVFATGSTSALILVATTTGFFTVVTPLLLHYMTGKYVSAIKYDSERDFYTATMYSLFLQKRQIEFTPDDVTKPGMHDLVTTCYIHNTPAFFDVHQFTDVSHYRRIMGYDKPMDFQLETQGNSQSINSNEPKKN